MPAGNDANAAAAELADQFGAGNGGAQELIAASRSRYGGDLGKAQLLGQEDVEVDLDVLAKVAGVKSVDSAAVRGDFIVYVRTDERDVQVKDVIERSALEGKKGKKGKKEAEPADDTPPEAEPKEAEPKKAA